jgi:hypothetical protein
MRGASGRPPTGLPCFESTERPDRSDVDHLAADSLFQRSAERGPGLPLGRQFSALVAQLDRATDF